MIGIQSRKSKTAVFSGTAKQTHYTKVLSLEELCLNCLKNNYVHITYLGNAPYYLIKPVLQKCDPENLFRIEDYNPDLIAEDDELWQVHCNAEFRGKKPEEDESWREMYIRLKYERELRLKSITANIHRKKQLRDEPVRKTKLAYVESLPKPPRGVKRAQELNGTKFAVPGVNKKVKASIGISNNGESSGVTPKYMSPCPSNKKVIVKKTAPLMRKSLDMMKSRFRR